MDTPTTQSAQGSVQAGPDMDNGEGRQPPAHPRPFGFAEIASLIGAPLAWVVVLLFHPTGEGEDFYPIVKDEVTAFVAVHVGTLIFVPLMAAAVYPLLRGVKGPPRT